MNFYIKAKIAEYVKSLIALKWTSYLAESFQSPSNAADEEFGMIEVRLMSWPRKSINLKRLN